MKLLIVLRSWRSSPVVPLWPLTMDDSASNSDYAIFILNIVIHFWSKKKCGCSMCHTVRYNACHARILVANFPIWSSITRYSGTLAERVILYIKKHCSIVCRRQSRQIVSFLCYSEKSPANIIALIGLQTNIRSHLPLFLLAATTTTTITTSFINTTYS